MPARKKKPDPADTLERLRAICMALPEVTERLSHGANAWFVRDKKLFMNFADHSHHDDWPRVWVFAAPGVQEELIEQEPERFFRPRYVGHKGWVGVRMDRDIDWDEMAAMAKEAYRLVAPKSLVKQLEP